MTLEEGIVTAQNVRKTQLEFTAISEHCAGSGSGTSLVKQAIAPVETSEISSTLLCEEKNKTGHWTLLRAISLETTNLPIFLESNLLRTLSISKASYI